MARVGQAESLNIVWRPFELRPEGAPPLPKEYIDRHWSQSVGPLSRELGVPMNRPEAEPRTTRLAHEATEYASRIGKGPAMADAIFRAHWQEGRDIGRIEVICDIALSVGLDPVEVRQVLTERSLQAEVESGLQLAARYGITSVPTFIIGNRFMVRGLTSEEHLLKAIRACRGEGLIQLEE